MKKVLFLAVSALLAIASCTKVNETYAPDQAISFQATVQLNQTKAIDGVNNTKGDTLGFPYNNFGVYAWEDGTQAFIVNETVTKGTSSWNTAVAHYWPKTGDIDFIGYYPQSATPWLTVAKDALSCSSYTISSAENEDLLYSTKSIDRTVKNSASGVPMIFHHALAKVGVVVKADYLTQGTGDDLTTWEIKIQELYFDDMYKTGSLSMSLASDNMNWTLPTNEIWTVSGSTADLAILGSEYTVKTTADTVLMAKVVMPQDLTGKKMHVKYSIKTTTGGVSTTQSGITADIKLFSNFTGASDKDAFSNSVDKWKMNKWIFYKLTINPLAKTPEESVITFAPALVDWVYVDGGSYTL